MTTIDIGREPQKLAPMVEAGARAAVARDFPACDIADFCLDAIEYSPDGEGWRVTAAWTATLYSRACPEVTWPQRGGTEYTFHAKHTTR